MIEIWLMVHISSLFPGILFEASSWIIKELEKECLIAINSVEMEWIIWRWYFTIPWYLGVSNMWMQARSRRDPIGLTYRGCQLLDANIWKWKREKFIGFVTKFDVAFEALSLASSKSRIRSNVKHLFVKKAAPLQHKLVLLFKMNYGVW